MITENNSNTSDPNPNPPAAGAIPRPTWAKGAIRTDWSWQDLTAKTGGIKHFRIVVNPLLNISAYEVGVYSFVEINGKCLTELDVNPEDTSPAAATSLKKFASIEEAKLIGLHIFVQWWSKLRLLLVDFYDYGGIDMLNGGKHISK